MKLLNSDPPIVLTTDCLDLPKGTMECQIFTASAVTIIFLYISLCLVTAIKNTR